VPAFGFTLLLLGLWLVIRTVRGGLVERIASL
jgi:hypothetical protein